MDTKFEFVKCDGVADKLKRLQKGSIDIAIGGLTITEDPEMIFDFTHQSGSAIQAAISDHQQSWGYEEGPWKGPGPCSAGRR